ncbi:hypothetical protein AQUCO_01300769v1 [Aquilegia coerulea]|uniref:Uncharacterized protein n=1 Tax=Aquilegia coerulea TaxID=218851 RepID=A0A2G5E3F5_AQUCA|nr:hypothetical protein AQUCO_01300769v1 [Aquilegia coerulea]
MDNQIVKAKEEALSRKDLLDKVDKWISSCEEKSWLEDYNRFISVSTHCLEQLTTEQESLFGSKPTPSRSLGPKKVVGPRGNGNATPRRLSMNPHQSGDNGMKSTTKEGKRDITQPIAPVNYVALPKKDAASHVSNTESIPASP